MTNYAPKRTNYDTGDRRWLPDMLKAETHGVSLSGDVSAGLLKSGTHIGIVTASGLGGRYAPADAAGRQTSVGLLVNDVEIKAGEVHHVAVVHAGTVDRRYLPADSGHDAAAAADLPAIVFIR